MTLPSRILVGLVALSCAALPARAARPAPAGKPASLPDILQVERPADGEWFGLYLMGKKVGYAFSRLHTTEHRGQEAIRAVNELTLKASVGGVPVQRAVREERVYEYRNNGRLLAFHVEKRGDGGEETLVGTCTPKGIKLVRKRPGLPDETRSLPATAEVVELADGARLVAQTGKPLSGRVLDLENTLTDKAIDFTLAEKGTHSAAGVTVPVVRVRTVQEPLRIPTVTTLTADGRLLELRLGDVVGKAEDEALAKQSDKVDLFSLTRVVLDRPLARKAREAPAEVRYRVQGVPAPLRVQNSRQTWREETDSRTLLVVRARLPEAKATRPLSPAKDPQVEEALRPTLAVESTAPAIVALARQIVGEEKDAWAAAKALNAFVYRHLEKAYGTSSDRATDVLIAKKGDCTEHALLMTALSRAAGIPARRVDGLVYMEAGDGVPALYWHEWVEVYVGEWVAMDPTFNQPVADATHIALGGEGRSDIAALIGQLKVTVVGASAEPD